MLRLLSKTLCSYWIYNYVESKTIIIYYYVSPPSRGNLSSTSKNTEQESIFSQGQCCYNFFCTLVPAPSESLEPTDATSFSVGRVGSSPVLSSVSLTYFSPPVSHQGTPEAFIVLVTCVGCPPCHLTRVRMHSLLPLWREILCHLHPAGISC